MKGLHMTREQAEAHQKRHGFLKDLQANRQEFHKAMEGRIVSKPRDRMNKTEREYSLIIEAMKRRGEILRWEFEGMTLRLADDCKFTPDFFVIVSEVPLRIRFCEVKGKHIWDDSKVKFRIARKLHSWAQWELHQKNKDGWTRLL
jgi:hypothetical protein